jgi:sugar lactone lactonase YvrE
MHPQPAQEPELFLDARAELGEGVRWHAAAGRLIWVDIMAGKVHLVDPVSGLTETFDIGQPVGAAAPAKSGGAILAVRDGFARLNFNTGAVEMVAEVERDRPNNRMNDGACDAAGRFWAGTMSMNDAPGEGSLYRLDPDGRVHTMLRSVSISNGIDWSLDNRLMYYIDSPTRRIDVCDFDLPSGSLANRRPFVKIDRGDGFPDGLTVDAEGAVWVALWDGGAVRRYTPDGVLDGVIRLPVTRPTTCAFGGSDLAALFITSAWTELPEEERQRQPAAGGMFRHRPGVTGRPAHPFGG